MYLENKKKNRFASESSWATLPVQSDQSFSLHRFFSLDWCFIWSLQQTENTKAILVQCITVLSLLKKTKIKCSSENYFQVIILIQFILVHTTIWTKRLGIRDAPFRWRNYCLTSWHNFTLQILIVFFAPRAGLKSWF